MSRRSLAMLSLALGTLTLGACSDITAPVATSQRQIQPTSPRADNCPSGYADSTGKGC
jgi:hypothetical protein